VPVKTAPLLLAQPSGEANETGTATTSRKETAIRAKSASWKSKIIMEYFYKIEGKILECSTINISWCHTYIIP
jgi:hypothetical protein